MLIVKVEGSIEKALKQFKRKEKDTRLVKQLRERQNYTKPSQKKREKRLKAVYVQKMYKNNDSI